MSEKDICQYCGAESQMHGLDRSCPTYFKNGEWLGWCKHYTFTPEPKRTEWRVLPADKLVRVLVDGGWVPDKDGFFSREEHLRFTNLMWSLCGEVARKLKYGGYFSIGHYSLDPSWVHEVEVEDE